MRIVALAVAILLLAAPARGASVADAPSRADRLLAKYFTARGPGVAVAVVRDGAVAYEGFRGRADIAGRVAIDAESAFDLASVSKQFTAMAIMMLAEEGRLSYDQKVVELVPGYAVETVGRPVRVQDLLWHTSGLVDYLEEYEGSDEEFSALTARTHLDWLNAKRARRAPGVAYEYNNSGYVLLSLVVEEVTGQRFSEFLGERIFQPLGMAHTTVLDRADLVIPNQVTGYRTTRTGTVRKSSFPSVITGDGNVFSTVEDLARWDAALGDGRLVSAATLERAFTTGTLDDGSPVDIGSGYGYGFGWVIDRSDGRLVVCHSGSWYGTATYVLRFVTEGVTVIVLSNDDNGRVIRLGTGVARVFGARYS